LLSSPSPARLIAFGTSSPDFPCQRRGEGRRSKGEGLDGPFPPSLCRSTRTVCCIKLLLHALWLIMTTSSHHPRRSRSYRGVQAPAHFGG
jgi:hypothetical protein